MSSRLLVRKAVTAELGICRNTLSKIVETDPTFPRFFSISPGVQVIERSELDAWIEQKRLAGRLEQIGQV